VKAFLIYYEPWKERLQLPESVVVVAETAGKAETYFKKHYAARLLQTIPIKQI